VVLKRIDIAELKEIGRKEREKAVSFRIKSYLNNLFFE